MLYENGRGTEKDPDEAAKWYRRASELGNRDGTLNAAMVLLARKNSEDKVKEAEGVAMLRRAAEAGQSVAQHLLGLRLRAGDGVPKDEEEGMRWIQRAANQGLPRAQAMIGALTAQGKGGLRKDPVAAHAWLSLAVDGDDKQARRNRDTIAKGLSPAQLQRSAALQAELRAKIAIEPEPGVAPAR